MEDDCTSRTEEHMKDYDVIVIGGGATPIPGLFVGGASMYPGGMVLGGSGFLAAGVVGHFLAGRQ